MRYPLAKANAEKAVALDPQSAAAHTAVAFLRYKFEWRWQQAEREFERAIALDPKSLAIRSDLVPPLLRAGRPADARAVVAAGLEIDPNWYQFPLRLVEILTAEHRDREAAEELWRAMVLRGDKLSDVEELRTAFDKGGRRAMLEAQIAQLLREERQPSSPASYRLATSLSLAYGALGDQPDTLHWLEVAVKRREDAVILMPTDPSYDCVRQTPEFLQLLEQVGLAPR